MTVVGVAFIVAGAVILGIGTIGLMRLPDMYTRAHAVGKSETLGLMLVLGGVAILEAAVLVSLRILIALFFAAVANATAIHVIARAARREGIEPRMGRSP